VRNALLVLGLAVVPFATGPASTRTAPAAMLDGTAWTLSTLSSSAAESVSHVTLEFSKGRVQGTDGCNHYSGSYRAGDGKFAVAPDLISTQMACPTPIMERASAYISALLGARNYLLGEGQVQLLGADMSLLVTLKAQPPTAPVQAASPN
jgi:heat shock protein HslJ